MAQTHASSSQVVSVRPLGERLGEARTSAILKAGQLELVRVVLPAGKGLRQHSAPGELTVQCLEGRIELSTPQGRHLLEAGDLVHLPPQCPHALTALVDSSALVTLCLVRAG